MKIGITILQNYKKNTNVKADDEEVMVIGQRFIRSIWAKCSSPSICDARATGCVVAQKVKVKCGGPV